MPFTCRDRSVCNTGLDFTDVHFNSGYTSINQQSHRVGYTALNTNQYQQDYPRNYGDVDNNEKTLLVPFLTELKVLVENFKKKMGDPIDPVTGL